MYMVKRHINQDGWKVAMDLAYQVFAFLSIYSPIHLPLQLLTGEESGRLVNEM